MSVEEFLANPPFPFYVQFETSTVCQAQCIMCPRTNLMKRRGTMPWHLINKIVREIAPQTESVCPFLYGEPFLEFRLTAILANIKQRNPHVRTIVYSNMNALPEQTVQEIFHNDLLDELHISFYGPTRELYAKWQPPLDYDRTVENIKHFHSERARLGRTKPDIHMHVLAVPDIVEAQEGYIQFLPYADHAGFVAFDTHHGKIPDMTEGRVQIQLEKVPGPVPCERLWKTFNIHYDGTVVPCCIDFDEEIKLGNVETQSIAEIWHGKPFQELREMHLQKRFNDIPLCRECRTYEHDFSKEWINLWNQPTIKLSQ